MKPLILEYSEKAEQSNIDFSLIHYNKELNLSVDKKTQKPAISYLNMSTETFTKTYSEESDSDNDRISQLMGTTTQSLNDTENSDDDRNFISLQAMMSTKTLTEAPEVSDSDN